MWGSNASMHHCAANCDCIHPPAKLFCMKNPGMCFIFIYNLKFVCEPLLYAPCSPFPGVMSYKLEHFSEEGVSHLQSNAAEIIQMPQISS